MDINSVCWNLTNVCNKSCEYCFRELNEYAQSYEVNLGILNNLKMMGVKRITFSGGEPYLFPNILDLMKAAKQIGMTVYVVTNGSTLNKDNIKDCLEYVDKVSFSIDSPRGYINEKLGRGIDSYTHVRDLLPYIRELYDENRLLIDINSVVTLDPTHEYQELYYMLESISNELYRYNINKWKIIRFYPLRGKAIDNKDMNWVPDEDFIEIEKNYSGNHYVHIDVRNIKDMDDDFIVSPCGYLKKSLNGKEEVLVDLKPALRDIKGSGRNVQ